MDNEIIRWCLYNSQAMSAVTSIALFGIVALVVPVLFTLPSNISPEESGELHSSYIDANKSKTPTVIWGGFSLLMSLMTIVVYYYAFVQAKGETCKVVSNSLPVVFSYNVSALYILTLIDVVCLGFFYKYSQDMKKKFEKLDPIK